MKKLILFLISLAVFLPLVTKVYYDTNVFKVNRIEFSNEKIPVGTSVSILQLTDLHNKVFGRNNDSLIETIEELRTDIIVITGDLIDRRTDDFTNVFQLVDRIVGIGTDVYFVSGNHELGNESSEAFFEGLRARNVIILDNKHEQVTVDGVTINLIGVANFSTGHGDLEKAEAGINKDHYSVLLSHAPTIINDRQVSAELTLSGHAHGGQVRLPFIGALVAPDQGFFPELNKGTYIFDNNKHLYVDSGLGTSLLPIRFLNQSQLSLITLSAKD